MRQPNAEGVRSEAPRGRGAADAETSAEGARVEAPWAPRAVGYGEGVSPPHPTEGSGGAS